jgi:hypothetical protein
VAAQATPVSVDHDTPAMFQHDRTAEPATMAISSEQDTSAPVGTSADTRAAPVSQYSGLRVDFAQPGCDETWSGTGVLLPRGGCLSTTHDGSKERSVNRNDEHLVKDNQSCKQQMILLFGSELVSKTQ